LAVFDGGDELAGFKQRLVSAGVEPGHAASHPFDIQFAALEIHAVDVGDLQFAACRRLDRGGDVDDLVVVEVPPGDRVVGLRFQRLFLDAAARRSASNSTTP
jgi:hypothetical protein